MVGQLYNQNYSSNLVKDSIAAVRTASSAHGISPHEAALRWTVFHSILDGSHGDAVTFGVSKLEQLHRTLDAFEAGPLPDNLSALLSGIYKSLEGTGPVYYL